MPKLAFTKTNVREENTRFPKIKLEEKGQKARVLAVEAPQMEYVHTLQIPKIINGKAKMITKTRFRDGEPYETYDYEFVGNYICLGDIGTLENDGEDPKLCPMCRAHKEEDIGQAPFRKFALNLIRYATKQGKSDISTPFSVSVEAWTFKDGVFGKLIELADDYGDELNKHDIILTCANPDFQTYDIQVLPKAEYLQDKERKDRVAETFRENKADDKTLTGLIGRTADVKIIEKDVARIRAAWNIINGTQEAPDFAVTAADESLDDSLDSLLDGQTYNSDGNVTQSEFPETAAEPKAKPAAKAADEVDDFDDLLNDLD